MSYDNLGVVYPSWILGSVSPVSIHFHLNSLLWEASPLKEKGFISSVPSQSHNDMTPLEEIISPYKQITATCIYMVSYLHLGKLPSEKN